MLYSSGSCSLASRVFIDQWKDDLGFLLLPTRYFFLFFSSLPIFIFLFLFLFLFCYDFCLISCYLAYATQGTPPFRFASLQEKLEEVATMFPSFNHRSRCVNGASRTTNLTRERWSLSTPSPSFPPTSLLKDILVPVFRYFYSSVLFLFISHFPSHPHNICRSL